jgi:solute carrier family 35 protein C2
MIMSEFFLIKRTSVVTLSVCGIFKEVATIFISSLVFGDILTLINIIGLCITLFGIGLYNWFKLKMVTSRKQVTDEDQEETTSSHHLYSTVAESTPILLVDGGLSGYRDSEEDEENRHNRYEMR